MKILARKYLESARANAEAMIDQAAESARLRYITAGAGQALEYQATEYEAQIFSRTDSDSDYPMLCAERDALQAAGITLNLADIAGQVLATAQEWRQKAAAIKRVRREAKLRLAQAQSQEAITDILNSLAWP